ncbi:uncharacterized protein LOC132727342 [Ruditapes philippinarum]|uniref:uncharacterized protein LOC132727342 n=1 Tax=Ruditapes philippinarum TaxID=129788 RepID=UPI00295A5A93|nr:uncharacterized protein LOC132727342 [Ruditapes philippinarum]
MFQSPEYSNILSLKLSEVLEDVGVNEEMVMKRRRVHMLAENIHTVSLKSICENRTVYNFGSQSEGTTTIGLNSDTDILLLDYDYNVIQDWAEWKQNKINLLMIQDEDVTPGYCFLQLLRSDEPLFETIIPDQDYIRDNKGKILLKNTSLTAAGDDAVRHGPSNSILGKEGYNDIDIVFGYPCNSLPQSALHSLDRQSIWRWPISEMIRYAVSNGCFVVGTSSKISTSPELEWRISTSLGERCFMFNTNITQLHCYVLMKIILKTFLTPQRESSLSSFMCKTVVLHCIQNTDGNIWKKNNLFTCLTYCLLELQSYIRNENCPHFIIRVNNLMAGQFTAEGKLDILQKISNIIQSDGRHLLRICIDDFGNRLQAKQHTDRAIPYGMLTPRLINENISVWLFHNLARTIVTSNCPLIILNLLEKQNVNLKQCILKLVNYSVHGSRLEQLASRCLVPFLYSTLGSIMVSSNIRRNTAIQYQALKLLSLGLNSDVTSGRLKLASVLYSVGDMDRAEFILKQTENRYNCDIVEPLCVCWRCPRSNWSAEFKRKCREQNEDCINRITSFCVRFMQTEVNCIPRELQYELKRSTQDDMQHRSYIDKMWMDFAVVDSLPFLYFLQYKVDGNLQRHQDQHEALCNLVITTMSGQNLWHRETALNLIGQCMEQENKPKEAMRCYMLSLQQRERNNAAKFHICNLLRKHLSDI